MKSQLLLGLVQAELAWQDPEANRNHLTGLLAGQTDLDLVLLPETFTTGFSQNAALLAEDPQGPTWHWLRDQAARGGFTLAGSYVVKQAGAVYNRLVWAHPNGETGHYDKRHLFTMAGEHKRYEPGQQRVLFECCGWRLCPQVCYDLRFPVWSRSKKDYDLLFYVANWPAPRAAQWQRLLPARAIENQAYVAAVNRIGSDGKGIQYLGHSQAYDPLGESLIGAGQTGPVLRASLEAAQLASLRQQFPVLDDADDFLLKI